jgi:hypothetical protein
MIALRWTGSGVVPVDWTEPFVRDAVRERRAVEDWMILADAPPRMPLDTPFRFVYYEAHKLRSGTRNLYLYVPEGAPVADEMLDAVDAWLERPPA